MYLEYLGIFNAMDRVIGVTMTMFIGPFASEGDREDFAAKCRNIIAGSDQNPNQIKFLLHDTLPVMEEEEGGVWVTEDDETGGLVPMKPMQWGATSPEDFLEFLEGAEK